MINNYIKTACRNFIRHKSSFVINVTGLSVGLACCLLIFIFIRDELDYDRFHQQADQTYRVIFSTSRAGTPTNANGIFGVGPALKKDFPEVKEFTRIRKTGQTGTKSLVRYEDKSFYEERFFFADSTVFELFSAASLSAYVGLVMITGLLGGFYPAFMLTRFKPVNTLKGNLVDGGSGSLLRKGLVVFQFAISMALIASTVIVHSQLNYIQTKDLGYAEDQIIVLPLNDEVRNRYESFRSELLQHTGIVNSTASSLVPTLGSSHNAYTVEGVEFEYTPSFSTNYIDEHYADTYGLRLLAGENARREVLGERGGDFLFSELAVQELGLESSDEILGRRVQHFEAEGRATGVVNDIHIYSLRENMYASVYVVTPKRFHKYLSIRLNPQNISDGIQYAERLWNDMFPGYPFEYFFLDESFEQMHRSDIRLAGTITWFSLLAIFVACLGLFGISAYTAERRIKEIGIRKVLGARTGAILALFSKEFMKLVVIGSLIAVPVAWHFSNNWLQEYVYRIEIGAMPFILAGFLLFAIALATISYHSIRAAGMNPVDSLRSE